jgi:hypothetical protein
VNGVSTLFSGSIGNKFGNKGNWGEKKNQVPSFISVSFAILLNIKFTTIPIRMWP